MYFLSNSECHFIPGTLFRLFIGFETYAFKALSGAFIPVINLANSKVIVS